MMVIVGGSNTDVGPLFGVAFSTILSEMTHGFEGMRQLQFGVAIVVIVLLVPRGLVGAGGQLPSGSAQLVRRVKATGRTA